MALKPGPRRAQHACRRPSPAGYFEPEKR
jgi:hypothetical protein